MSDAAPTTALPVPDGGTDAAWRETSMLYFRAAVERLYWQDIAVMHSRVANCGNISPRCVFGLSAVARFCHNAFPSCRPWQDLAAMRSRAAIRGGFFTSCVPEGASDGKSAPSWQHIAAMHPKRAGFGKIFAPCIRKALRTGVREYTARRSCQEGALFTARAPQIMHGVRILPSFGARRVLGLMRERLGAGLRKRIPYCCRRSRVPARHLVAFCGGSLSRSKRLALRYAAPAVTIPCRDRPRPAADAPPSFGRQRLPMTQRTKNGQHFAGRFCEVMS